MSEFRQRVEAAIPALRRYARALTRDSETADDIVQDTLVRALRSEHLFHDGDVRAWLYTILTNLNRNRLRSLSRRPTLTPIKDSDAAITGPDTGSRDIARALDDLAEDQRAALSSEGVDLLPTAPAIGSMSAAASVIAPIELRLRMIALPEKRCLRRIDEEV